MSAPRDHEHGDASRPRVRGFHDLMSRRVQDILLVSSLYESFILAEDGQLNELILSEFLDLNLHHTPGLTRLSTASKALDLACNDPRRYNLIITTINPGDMDARELARAVKKQGLDVPVILLAFDNRELSSFLARGGTEDIDRIFLWQGDVRILLAIVKYVEDRWNVDADCEYGGVQSIFVIEDNIRFYSSYLPMIYTEVVKHSQSLISEGINLSHKILRMRARPKILLCSTYEEAWEFFTRMAENTLGIISDVEFPRNGEISTTAGLEFARQVHERWPDVPILLQSSRPENAGMAQEVGGDFLLKGSPTLLNDLRRFMTENLAFGEFVFRLPDGTEVGRAENLRSLEQMLRQVPAESIAFHGEKNHFSNWLKARTEFDLAHKLRPRRVSDFPTVEHIRQDLIRAIAEYRRERHHGTLSDFDPASFDVESSFARIGGGSLGGKARGLAFVRRMIAMYWDKESHPEVEVTVPPAVVLGTDVFDAFLDHNDLREIGISCDDDDEILHRFLAADFPPQHLGDLRSFLELARFPLAVRSSSLLEDSQYQPFTGVYATYMLANNQASLEQRLYELVGAVKRVYASTFSSHAKGYLKVTPYRLEEEKMAVILQKIVGARRGTHYYPSFAGVARSHNFYPTGPMEAEDGIVAVALGLGRAVVEGERCVRFSPAYPKHLPPAASIDDAIDTSQRSFWAIDLNREGTDSEVSLGLDVAEQDGTLAPVGSTYCPENEAMHDGLSRQGVRVVTFAPILKHKTFPLAEITHRLMKIGERGMGAPVEIEFAVNLDVPEGRRPELGFLQMRPLVMSRETEEIHLEGVDDGELVCRSPRVLGSGRIDNLHDVIVLDADRFDRSRSREAAAEVGRMNARLLGEERPYLLIGVGRWGSTDPWLGVPVAWDEIAGARVIVEAGFQDFVVQPSQGTHFFQNLASFEVGYFTVNQRRNEGFVDWEWLSSCDDLVRGSFARLLRFEHPLVVMMDPKSKAGVILKPGDEGL